jgi:hypothetical protein
MVPWDAQRCKLSPGELITALIICCFLRQRPLYKVFLAFEETDCELLVGRGVVADDLNDDALGRALDKFAAGGPEKIFAAICARAAVMEAVDRRLLCAYRTKPITHSDACRSPNPGHADHFLTVVRNGLSACQMQVCS